MSMINKGIPYFPTSANFFEEEVMELLEAKFGVLASYIVLRLLCKIYKEGYYISWGKEEMVEKIVELLLEKGFFHKETYDQYGVLTSEQIQKVWMEATVRRKIDYSQLPYLLAPKEKNGRQKGELNKENVDILQAQVKVSSENDDIFRQTKLNQTKLYSEEEDKRDASFEIPGYAYNQATHNINGLIESLDRYKVTNPEEKQTILRLSDYGRKGTQVWRLFSSTSWSKIGAPGKYIIAALTNKR